MKKTVEQLFVPGQPHVVIMGPPDVPSRVWVGQEQDMMKKHCDTCNKDLSAIGGGKDCGACMAVSYCGEWQ